MKPGLIIPEIRFGAYLLRAWGPQDIEVLKEAAMDPYIPLIATVPREWSEQSAVDFVERQHQRAADGSGYPFAIIGDRGVAVGHIGLWVRDLDRGRAEIGYWVVASARGSGIASAALTALSDWAFSQIGVPRLELYIEPGNIGSIRTAERAGYIREGLLRSWYEMAGERRDMEMFAKINPRERKPEQC